MKKRTIIRLFVFILPLFFVWGAIEYFWRAIPNNYTVKNENITKNAQAIEVLLFGSSHCLYGLNPKYFSKNAFNSSNVSQTIYFDKLLLEHYIDKLPQLKQVVFCIGYHNLSQADNTQDDVFRKYYYEAFMDLEVPSVSKFDPNRYSLALSRNLNASIDMLSEYYKRGTIVNCDEKGWGNNYKKRNRIEPKDIAKWRANLLEDNSMDFSLNQKRIQDLIEKCKKKDIEVVIVSMPYTRVFIENLNPEKLEAVFGICKSFESKNRSNVRYLNLLTDKRFVDEDFFDADHLNEVGAEKCSKIVDEFLNSNN